MSASLELQDAIIVALKGDAAIMELVNGAYDIPPTKPFGAKETYISLGPCDYVPTDADCIIAGEYTQQIDVWSRKVGYPTCKIVTDLVKRALHRREVDLQTIALVEMQVSVVRFMRDPDGLTSRGMVTVSAMIEEDVDTP